MSIENIKQNYYLLQNSVTYLGKIIKRLELEPDSLYQKSELNKNLNTCKRKIYKIQNS